MTGPVPHLPIGAEEVCQAFEDTLTEHLPAVLERLAATRPDYQLPMPENLEQVPDPDVLIKEKLPALAISSDGTVGTPARLGDGRIRMEWRIYGTVFARGSNWRDTQRKVRHYVLAMRTVVLTNGSLGGIASAARVQSEAYARIDAKAASRTLGGGDIEVIVRVDNANNDIFRPTEADPDAAGVPVTDVDVTVRPGHPALS